MAPKYDYDLAQQIYALSVGSNAVGFCKDKPDILQGKLRAALDTQLQEMSGGWQVSWGPCVFKPHKLPENVFYAAVSESQRYVVVAVAGTSAYNWNDWAMNFDVVNVVDFVAWETQWKGTVPPPEVTSPTQLNLNNAYIAKGTADGVYNILSKTPSATVVPIWQYLAGLDPSYTVIITGHSMGGAIAPALALGLKMSGLAGTRTIYAMPSAGPSPGNAAFNTAFTSNSFTQTPIPGVSQDYGFFNTNFYNTNDVVPQAWCVDPLSDRYMARIPQAIYTSSVVSNSIVWNTLNLLVTRLSKRSRNSKIGYYGIPGTSFTEPFRKIESCPDLLTSLAEQHMRMYWTKIDVIQFAHDIMTATGCRKNAKEAEKEEVAEFESAQQSSGDVKGTASTVDSVEIIDV